MAEEAYRGKILKSCSSMNSCHEHSDPEFRPPEGPVWSVLEAGGDFAATATLVSERRDGQEGGRSGQAEGGILYSAEVRPHLAPASTAPGVPAYHIILGAPAHTDSAVFLLIDTSRHLSWSPWQQQNPSAHPYPKTWLIVASLRQLQDGTSYTDDEVGEEEEEEVEVEETEHVARPQRV